MFKRPSSPRSIGGNLDDAFRLYAASWRAWLWPSLLGGVLSGGMQFITNPSAAAAAANPRANPMAALAGMMSPPMLLAFLVVALASIWVYCTILAALDDVYNGRPASTGAAFGLGIRLVPSALIAGILYFLGTALGFVLLVVPGIIISGRWLLYGPALVAERAFGPGALQRSWQLVQGHWWRTVTVITVALIIIIVLALSVPLLAGIALGIMHKPGELLTVIVAFTVLERVVTAAAIPAALLVVYYDLRLRKEGSDLSSRVDKLTAG